MRLIDADALERDGWRMSRTVQIDEKTMEAQTRKPTDFPAIEPQPEPCEDTISRQSAIQAAECIVDHHAITPYQTMRSAMDHLQRILRGMPSAQPEWIPCSERLPKDIRPVIVTWKNTDPASYYQYIVGKHYTGTACYKNGKWYWYSSTTEDMLAEYGRYDSEEFDEAIECIAWMPLPEPYKGDE